MNPIKSGGYSDKQQFIDFLYNRTFQGFKINRAAKLLSKEGTTIHSIRIRLS